MLGAISGLDVRWGRPVQVWGQFEAGLGGVKILTSLTLLLVLTTADTIRCVII